MSNYPSESTRKMLLRAMHLDDCGQFRKILEEMGWPTDSVWSDYELLTYAIKNNHRRITHLLLDKGARVTKNCQRVNTPLHYAARKKTAGWPKVIARLLSQGASVDAKNNKTDTALHVAFKQAPGEIIDMLLQAHLDKSTLDVYNKDRLGFMHIACTRPNLDFVQQLAENVNLVNCQVSLNSCLIYAGYTTLHFAVEHGRLEIAEFLLRHGADIYKQNANGSTPLHLALQLRHIEMIDLILDYDEDKKNAVNNSGLSHFMAACAGKNESLVNDYLGSPSSVSALINSQVRDAVHCNISGYSPLHFAAEFNRRRTVELLLSKGADCCLLAAHDVTPHILAHQGNHKKITDLLDEQCGTYPLTSELLKVADERYIESVENDEPDDIMIVFEKRIYTVSSSDEDSVGSDDDIARHEDHHSLIVNKDNPNAENRCNSRLNNNFDAAQISVQNLHFYNADKNDYPAENVCVKFVQILHEFSC